MRAPQFAPFAERCSVAFFEGRSGADHAVRCCALELIADNVSEDGGLARELDRLAKEPKR